jgi:protein ImuB
VLHQGRILVASHEALRCGVRSGMRAGGVSAVAPDTVILDRNIDKENLALDAIAMALLQFTPEVVNVDDGCIVLDVSASLTLFGGPIAICQQVLNSVRRLGFTITLGAAPTATGAWLLARHPREKSRVLRRRSLSMKTLTWLLDRLVCTILPQAHKHEEWLTGIGVVTLGDIRKLPRPGLLRRTDQYLLEQLDRAYGQVPELFEWIQVPTTFSARLETYDRIEHADALMFGATRLILQLTGWLVSLHKAVCNFELLLEHERGRNAIEPTAIEIGLAEPAWHEQHLLRLLQERLARTELIAPVIAIRLEVRKLAEMLPPTTSLFPEPGGTSADWNRLMELLIARVGKEGVLTPACVHDYRPEICNTWVPVTDQPDNKNDEGQIVERPFWILAKPIALLMRDERPFYGSPLKLVRGPERIEAGWWDKQTTARDYCVAQDNNASCYWIYLERTREPRWYLHGLYA